MKKSDPTSIGDILKRLVPKTDLGKKLAQSRIWERWDHVAGAALAPHGRPHAIRDNVLIIEVDSTVWMNRYAYEKWEILLRANALYRREVVSDMFIMLTPDGQEGPQSPSSPKSTI